jgi:predicted DNA binding CopG/RHH family protein
VVDVEEEQDEQASQRPQELEQVRLELEERHGLLTIRAASNDLVEPVVDLSLQLVASWWTRHDGRITLRIAHGD